MDMMLMMAEEEEKKHGGDRLCFGMKHVKEEEDKDGHDDI